MAEKFLIKKLKSLGKDFSFLLYFLFLMLGKKAF